MTGPTPDVKGATREDWNWAQEYERACGHLVREWMIQKITVDPADIVDDMTKAKDIQISFELFKKGSADIACRCRRISVDKYGDITIRSGRPSGMKSELQKIKEGHGDYMVYGWIPGKHIEAYCIVDLDRMRQSGVLEQKRQTRWNKDWSSCFVFLSINELRQTGCLVDYHDFQDV